MANLDRYAGAFRDPGEPFLFHYRFDAAGGVVRTELSRGEFWNLGLRAATVLHRHGCGPDTCFALCFGANTVADLAFRLGAGLTGAVPVTVNWQADTPERLAFKLEATKARLGVRGEGFNSDLSAMIRERFPNLAVYPTERLATETTPATIAAAPATDADATRIVIFTSGTTGQPKGVRLPYRAYDTNRATFEQFLAVEPGDRFAVLVVNPLHHTNSTALTDWALRRPGSHLHLVERYATAYWKVLAEAAGRGYERFIAPTVARHFDFLENLDREGRLPVDRNTLRQAMGRTEFLIGSAPVGPTTVARLQRYSGRLPHVRFGSTETCLQVMGTPVTLSEQARERAFVRGWEHCHNGEKQTGYYIGRPHPPHTEVRLVRSVTLPSDAEMEDCDDGEPGTIVTRGANLMSGYVNNPAATAAVYRDGWYAGLKDVGFRLRNETDGQYDYYWVSRESTLLIRGGANYAYAQINAELARLLDDRYGLSADAVDVAVVGLKLESEHEDACCATIELNTDEACRCQADIEKTFCSAAAAAVSKGARPDHVRCAPIPRNFKGAILVRELAAAFRAALERPRA